METDKTDLEDLIIQAEAEIELNPVEFIQVGNAEYMKQLQGNLDGYYKDCLQKFGEWKRVYAKGARGPVGQVPNAGGQGEDARARQ